MTTIMLVAGEPSGDVLGARLMDALRARWPMVQFMGVGGEQMQARGLVSIVPLRELAVFGLAEILPAIPRLLARIQQVVTAALAARPAALVTIDAPDFSFRVAKKLRHSAIPLIHYVAPTVWAWRPGRAQKIAALYQHLLALLPFEPPYFTRVGLACTFVGHPVIEAAASGDGARFRARYQIAPTAPVLVVLPGSRMTEIHRLTPIFGAVITRLREQLPDLVLAIPTVATVAEAVERWAAQLPVAAHVLRGEAAKHDALAAGRAALAASGTVALELALAKLPAVIAYRISPLTAFLYRRLIRVRFANLVNIMHDRMAVPEYIQENCTAEQIYPALWRLLTDDAARGTQQTDLDSVRAWLSPPALTPSVVAADVVGRLAGLT